MKETKTIIKVENKLNVQYGSLNYILQILEGAVLKISVNKYGNSQVWLEYIELEKFRNSEDEDDKGTRDICLYRISASSELIDTSEQRDFYTRYGEPANKLIIKMLTDFEKKWKENLEKEEKEDLERLETINISFIYN
jgi:hypothetical protein